MLQVLLFTVTVVLFIKFIWDRWKCMNLLKSLNIPGPSSNIFNGNIPQLFKMGFHPFLEANTKKYGKFWGYNEGVRPTIVVSDVEALKQIYIKEFSKMHSRKKQLVSDDEYKNVFDSTDLHQWKRLRAIGSPSFSALRMKEMSPLINHCVDNIVDLFEQKCKSGEHFNIHGDWQKLTLDIISACAFGIDTNSIKDPDSIFLEKCRGLFFGSENLSPLGKLMVPLLFSFPSLTPFLSKILMKQLPVFQIKQWFLDTAKEILKTRKESKTNRVDFIKLMLEANDAKINEDNLEMVVDDDEEENKEPNKASNIGEIKATNYIKLNKQMSLPEMQANSFIMLTAGYETTSTALAFASYELALNPHILEKLQQEIDEHFPDKNCRPNYLNVHKMQYLDMFISEILRLHTIAAVASTRQLSETCKIGDYTIPSGFQIQINTEAVHMDPELWGPENPKECVPERFLPEAKANRHPMAWIPFGGGPRNCIGMRFALMEAKIALVRVLRRFNIERCQETRVPLPLQKRIIKGPSEGVYVKLTAR